MKSLNKYLLLSLIFFNAFAIKNMLAETFEFIDQKNYGVLSDEFLSKLKTVFNAQVFFETGTFLGGTTLQAAKHFNNVITVELHDKLFTDAEKKFISIPNITAYHATSPTAISLACPKINDRIIFWLDAHYSGDGTALSNSDQKSPNAFTAVREELEAIQSLGITDCIILIDDIRGFGSMIGDREFLGCWAYPKLQEVVGQLKKINKHFECILIGDILLAYDATQFNPKFSKTAIACTKLRLYDGKSLTSEELIQCAHEIRNALPHEKDYIRKLYESMAYYNDPMFWHDIWFGLVERDNQSKVSEAYTKITTRISPTDLDYIRNLTTLLNIK